MSRLLTLILLLNGGLVSLVVADDITPAATVVDTMVPLDAEKTPFTPPIEKDQSEEKEDKEFRDNLRKKAIKPEEKSIFWNNENNAFSLKVKTGIMNHSHLKIAESYVNAADKTTKGKVTDIDAKVTSPYVGVGLAWSVGTLSLAVNGQRTDRRNIGELVTRSAINTLGDYYNDNIFWREDYDASLSWRFDLNPNHSLLFFGGYKLSKTHYDTRTTKIPTAPNLPTKETTENVTGVDSAGKSISIPDKDTVIDRDQANVQVDTKTILFNSSGPFVGLGYSLRLSEQNDTRLGFTIGYGKLKGSVKQIETRPKTITEPNGGSSEEQYISEGTQGFRYGVYLTGPIPSSRTKLGELSYTLGIDAYNYTIKQKVETKTAEGGFRYFTDQEKVLNVGASIGYKF